MPARSYQPLKPKFSHIPPPGQLPLSRPIAIYYRQSTEAQVGNISTSMQTVDMVGYLQTQGWSDKNIIMIDMDAGISGSTKIDERPGMSHLFKLITTGKIGAVACQDEDRLFRDVTQIQVNIFIEACRTANIVVMTPSMVYDFANEMTGLFHARQFRFKSEMAAEYINSVIRGKLHRAKRRLLLAGRWAGPGMPPGYMADTRKTLPDGTPNEHWRRFVIFEPYAAVVREYFRLFLSFSGNVRKTVRHIHAHGPYYPDPAQTPVPEGYRVVYRIRPNEGKFRPTRAGMAVLLTNAQYIGHWMVNGAIVRWHNHPSIIDEPTFLRAFNYLSSVDLQGELNPHYQPFQQNARPSLDERRPIERPLCAGMIMSCHQEKWGNVGTNWVSSVKHYTYVFWANNESEYTWGRKAVDIDNAVESVVQAKLSATFNSEAWLSTISEMEKTTRERKALLDAQLSQLKNVMKNLEISLETLTNAQLILATQTRYEAAVAEYARLQTRLAEDELEDSQLAYIHELRANCDIALETWDELSREEKRAILHAFISRIEALPIAHQGLQIIIHWRDGSTNETRLKRTATTGQPWSHEEAQLLLRLVDQGKTQIQIAKAFPSRQWRYIMDKLARESGFSKRPKLRPKPIREYESYNAYLQRKGKQSNLSDMNSDCHRERAGPDAPG